MSNFETKNVSKGTTTTTDNCKKRTNKDNLNENTKAIANGDVGTVLHLSAKDGKLKSVKKHIKNTNNIDPLSSKFKQTPLHLAAQNSNVEVCKVLVEAGACVDAKDISGFTPLHLAVATSFWNKQKLEKLAQVNKVYDVCKFLVEAGADVNSKDKFDKTAYFYAWSNCFHTVAKYLKSHLTEDNVLKYYPKVENGHICKDCNEHNFKCCFKESTMDFQSSKWKYYCIFCGVPFYEKDFKEHITVVHQNDSNEDYSIKTPEKDSDKFNKFKTKVLDRMNPEDQRYWTRILLNQTGRAKLVFNHNRRYKLENGDYGLVLHDLAQKGSTLLENWMWDLDATTFGAHRTPLMLAAEKGHFDTCEVLVQAGAELKSEDLFAQTAYDIAYCNGHHKIPPLC